jgi:hypothetical protein
VKPTERRRDGWPLCPCCGQDELAVLETPPATVYGGSFAKRLAWFLERPLFCYGCGRVTVEAGEAAIVPGETGAER